MNDYLVDFIAKKLANELYQDDIEELVMANPETAFDMLADLEAKENEYDFAPYISSKHGNFKPHTVAEIRNWNRKYKGSDRAKGKRSHWGCKMYYSGRNNKFEMSAKERRYAEAAKPIDDITKQEAAEMAEAEALNRERDKLDDKYMEICAKIFEAHKQIDVLRDYIEDLEYEKSEIICDINYLYL